MLINLQEIKDFVSISAVADYLGLEEEYGKRKFPGERTASIELYPNTQTFYDFGRAVGGDIFDLLSHIKGIGLRFQQVKMKRHLVRAGLTIWKRRKNVNILSIITTL